MTSVTQRGENGKRTAMSVLWMGLLLTGLWVNSADAVEWKMQDGGIEPGKVVLGMRAGFAPVTQSITGNTSSVVLR